MLLIIILFSRLNKTVQLIDIIAKTGGAIMVLLIITGVSVYKPWGNIQHRDNTALGKTKTFTFYAMIVIVLLIFFAILKHLFAGGMQLH